MCHIRFLVPTWCRRKLLRPVRVAVDLDLLNPDLGKVLAMPLQLFVLLLPLVMEDQDFIAPTFPLDRSQNPGITRLDDRASLAGERQDFAELNLPVLMGGRRLNFQNVARRDAILFAACANDSVHKPSHAPTERALKLTDGILGAGAGGNSAGRQAP